MSMESFPQKPTVDVHILPGGRLPERMSERAVGFDAFARAIVSAYEMDPDNPILRRTIFDFVNIPEEASLQAKIELVPDPEDPANSVWGYRLDPGGDRVTVGLGIVTALPEQPYGYESLYWVAPRSGMASKYGITSANAPGTVDADYRGEAGIVLINHGDQPFYITQNTRICQNVFMVAMIPEFNLVENYADLSESQRGAGGFGSTGGFSTS